MSHDHIAGNAGEMGGQERTGRGRLGSLSRGSLSSLHSPTSLAGLCGLTLALSTVHGATPATFWFVVALYWGRQKKSGGAQVPCPMLGHVGAHAPTVGASA